MSETEMGRTVKYSKIPIEGLPKDGIKYCVQCCGGIKKEATTSGLHKLHFILSPLSGGKPIIWSVGFGSIKSIAPGDVYQNGSFVDQETSPTFRININTSEFNRQRISLNELGKYKSFEGKSAYSLFRYEDITFGRTGVYESVLWGKATVTSGKSGQRKSKCVTLLIPVTEIFRTYYATTSKLAKLLLHKPVAPKDSRFFCSETHFEPPNQFHLHPHTAMSHVDMMRLLPSLYYENEKSYAAKQVDRLHEALSRQMRTEGHYPLRLEIGFPFAQELLLEAHLIKGVSQCADGRDIYLLKKISSSEYPLPAPIINVEYFEKSASGERLSDDLKEVNYNQKTPANKDDSDGVDISEGSRPDSDFALTEVIRPEPFRLLDENKYGFVQAKKEKTKYKSKKQEISEDSGDYSSDFPSSEEAAKGIKPINHLHKEQQLRPKLGAMDLFEALIGKFEEVGIVVERPSLSETLSPGYAELPASEQNDKWPRIWAGSLDGNRELDRYSRERRAAIAALRFKKSRPPIYFVEIEKRLMCESARNPRKILDRTSESFCMFVYYAKNGRDVSRQEHLDILGMLSISHANKKTFHTKYARFLSGIHFEYFNHRSQDDGELVLPLYLRLLELMKSRHALSYSSAEEDGEYRKAD